jgi:putative glutamine amidotransferase
LTISSQISNKRFSMPERLKGLTQDPPIVGVIGNRVLDDGVAMEAIRTRYLEALRIGAKVTPIVIPTGLHPEEIGVILARCNGILLTGSMSNVAPERYGQVSEDMLTDRARDETVFALVKETVNRGVPLFGICRGLQEINVAFGGTLIPDLRDIPGKDRHDEDLGLVRDLQYAASHSVDVVAGGILAELLEHDIPRIWVNSLHRQAIARPGHRVRVEAAAPDGVIEAISIEGAAAFALAVQWHPEWFHDSDAVSRRLFAAFGDACHEVASASYDR